MKWVDRQFGSFRGLVRLALSHVESRAGAGALRPDPAAVRRLVFVCHGNICRSAFADVLARESGLHSASFGLSTSSSVPAHPPITAEAARRGISLADHRATRVEDFISQPGDLLLAMETRHLRKLAARSEFAGIPRLLLGDFAQPRFPHLHDPYEISQAYLPVCLDRIESAVGQLSKAFPGARRLA